MLTTTNKLTKAFASGSLAICATAAATLAGFGLASAPAQAGTLEITGSTPKNLTLPNSPFWVGAFGSPVSGVDNGLVSFTGGQLQVDFYGKGFNNPAALQNGFQLNNSISLSPNSQSTLLSAPPIAFTNQSPSNGPNWNVATPILTQIVDLTDGNIPFQFLDGGNGVIKNGASFTEPAPHYFAYQKDSSVYLGLDDSATSGTTSDSEDYLIKLTAVQVTAVPEPSSILGLLAIGGLGLAAAVKRQKQS